MPSGGRAEKEWMERMTVTERVLDARSLTAFVQALFHGLGVPEAEAQELAACLTDADLRGVSSHGVVRIPWYVNDLRRGYMHPTLRVSTLADSGPLLLLDGHDSIGHLVAKRAMAAGIERAHRFGVGVVGVRRSSHFGAAAYYAAMAAAKDQIGIVLTNGGAVMAPWGGREKLLGNTPIAVALPALEEAPIILDSAQTVVAHGKLTYAKERGATTVPAGWALDRLGIPTEDIDEALQGLLMPIGGHKGYAMAFVFDCICGLLMDAGVGEAIRTDEQPGPGPGHVFLVLDIGSFRPAEEFKRCMDARIRQIRTSPRAPGVERIYVPGEIEHQTRARRLREGVPLPDGLIQKLNDLARGLHVPELGGRVGGEV